MNAPVEQLITNSRTSAFLTCQRLHQIQYVQGYRALGSEEMEFGSLMHAGLEAWWLAYKNGSNALSDALTAMEGYAQKCEVLDESGFVKARVMMLAYDVRWSDEMADFEVLAVEKEFQTPLPTPKGKEAKGLKIAGKIDVLVRRISTNQVLMVEHKTSGADLSPGSTYWQRLRTNSQISMYHEGAKALGYTLDGCLYDVIVRPGQKMLKATPEESRKYVAKTGALYANQRAEDETLEDFEKRVTEVVAEDPNRYFARADIVRFESELIESRLDVYFVGVQIRDQIRTGVAPRNTNACQRFGHDCDFLPVCGGFGTLDDETRYKKLNVVHPELEGT